MKWIDGSGNETVGDAGFLVHIENQVKGWERFELRDRPPYTNQSREPMPIGWCGSHNDTSTYGKGVWQVVQVARNGRVQINKVLDRDKLEAFLNEYGYPELLDDLTPDA